MESFFFKRILGKLIELILVENFEIYKYISNLQKIDRKIHIIGTFFSPQNYLEKYIFLEVPL